MRRQDFAAACLAAAALIVLPGVVLPSTSAMAQGMPMPGFQFGAAKPVSPEEKARAEALEKAARDAQSTVPTEKANNDPWASVRASDSAPSGKTSHKRKTTAKPAH